MVVNCVNVYYKKIFYSNQNNYNIIQVGYCSLVKRI